MGSGDESTAWAEDCARRERAEGRVAAWLVAVLVPGWLPMDLLLQPDHLAMCAALRVTCAAIALALLVALGRARTIHGVRAAVTTLFAVTYGLVGWIVASGTAFLSLYAFGYSLVVWGSALLLSGPPRRAALLQSLAVASLAFGYALAPGQRDPFEVAAALMVEGSLAVIGTGSALVRHRLLRDAFGAKWELDQRNRQLVEAEVQLTRAAAELERRVEERTAQLTHSLAQLEQQVEERIAAEARAHEASRAKSTFLANMSHELRTPLNAILGYTELVAEDLHPVDQAELVGHLDRVRASAAHLLQIIDDVLDLSRIEAGRLELRPATIPLGPLIERSVQLVLPQAQARGNRVVVALDRGAPAVWADDVRLSQVLANLLSNAVKFTTDGEIRVVSRVRPDRAVEIDVADTGAGIPPSFLPLVFERFRQSDDGPTRVHGGVGLGLAICRELVGAMGGEIRVASALRRGTTFTLTLRTNPPA
jgi:signal transduction histidine kinase